MTLTRASGFPVGGGSGNGLTTVSVTPAAVGDLVIVSVLVASTTITVTGVSGGNSVSWSRGAGFTDATSTLRGEIWAGVATATGAQNATVTYSASVASTFCELDADSLHSSITGRTWGFVAGSGQHDTTTLTPAYPTLTATVTGQAYWGLCSPANTPSAGSTSGFTYNLLDSSFVCTALNLNVSSGSVSVTCNQSPTGVATATGVIITDAARLPPPVAARQAVKRAAYY